MVRGQQATTAITEKGSEQDDGRTEYRNKNQNCLQRCPVEICASHICKFQFSSSHSKKGKTHKNPFQ